MSNILIWIDSSIRIKKKILMLNETLSTDFDKVLFIAQDEKSAKIFLKEGICFQTKKFIFQIIYLLN